jgi:hypothetical protein
MTRVPFVRGLGAGALLLLFATITASAQTSLTVYNDGRVLVRRVFPVALPAGVSELKLSVGAIAPGSVLALDSGVVVVESRYDATVDEAGAVRRAVGRRLVFQLDRKASDTVSALLLGVDPERYKLNDSTISFVRPGIIRLPADLVTTDPVLTLKVRTAKARQQLTLAYFTQGTSWEASYQVIVATTGATSARVQGAAVVTNQPLRVDSAEIQLVAGDVGRANSRAGAMPMAYARNKGTAMVAMAAESPGEQRVGDVHVYTLPGRWSLQPGIVSTIALFDPIQVAVERQYVVEGDLPYWGVVLPHGDESEVPVNVRYSLSRPKGTEFGDRPLPAGVARLFIPDSAGRLQLVGEANVPHSAGGKDARMDAGTAFDITARRVQTAYVTRRDSTRAGIVRSGATASYSVTLSNAGDTEATVMVKEERGGEWSVVSSSVPAEKVSSTVTRFKVKVPAHGDALLTYRISMLW